MARATFVNKAQKDIYQYGKRVEYVSQKGKREGQTLTKIDRTIPKDENDPILIAKGESYWWWQFQNSPKRYSKEKPRQSELTQSAYLSSLYQIMEEIEDFSPNSAEEVQSFRDEIVSNIEELRDTTQDSLDNMPESLQYSPTGELLQERIDSLESAISEFESLDLDFEEKEDSEIKEIIAEEEGIDTDDDGWEDEITSDQLDEKREELEDEWVSEKLDEIQSISIE
jgi:hypothetical protein